MATQEPSPPASTSPSIESGEPGTDLTPAKRLAILEEKFAALERKFSHLDEKAISITENGPGKVTDVSVNSSTTNGVTKESTTGEKETGPPARAKIVINRFDPATGERKDQLPSETASEVSKAQDTSHAFLLRKNVDASNKEDNDGELEIISRDLWNLLKKLLSHYPYHIFKNDPVPIESPYEPFILNWDKLEEAAKESSADAEDNQARLDLKLLLDIISSGSSGDLKLDKYFKTRESNREQKFVTFESLWTIFSPGALVYAKPFLGQDQVFIVQDYLEPWPLTRRKPSKWTLECLTYDWNGKTFKRVALQLDIESFEGTRAITSLPFYPLEHHQQLEILKKRLVERGAKYKKFCTAEKGSQMFDYTGPLFLAKRAFPGSGETMTRMTTRQHQTTTKISNIQGEAHELRVRNQLKQPARLLALMVESWLISSPTSAMVQRSQRIRFDEDVSQEKWEEEQYMLCPPRILGYILSDKQWAQLQVTGLKDIPKVDLDHSWDRVKLADGEETKKMILNLVNGHGTPNSKDEDSGLAVDDIVAKKGKGLVILLYGPPGVGKTSTAETVAIAARKPLFSISVADVGTKARKVEANLAKLFALAASWQAILLIDEADVFLESRGKGASSSTERNALVSVFLRVLEYYQGILMLTTNQIAHFDVAVQSRIHVAIRYGKLSEAQTVGIFEGFLKPLDEKDLVKDMDDIREWIKEDVCKIGLDGRQIRNIVTSALGLTRAEGKRRLDKKDLKKILNNIRDYKDDFVRQFEKYKNSQDGMIS